MNKYFAKKIRIYGMKFDSKLELACYNELLQLQKDGKISGLRRADTFVLLKGFTHYSAFTRKKGVLKRMPKQRDITYTPDFEYKDPDGYRVVVEVKSYGTAKARDYPLRKKMFFTTHCSIRFIEWES